MAHSRQQERRAQQQARPLRWRSAKQRAQVSLKSLDLVGAARMHSRVDRMKDVPQRQVEVGVLGTPPKLGAQLGRNLQEGCPRLFFVGHVLMITGGYPRRASERVDASGGEYLLTPYVHVVLDLPMRSPHCFGVSAQERFRPPLDMLIKLLVLLALVAPTIQTQVVYAEATVSCPRKVIHSEEHGQTVFVVRRTPNCQFEAAYWEAGQKKGGTTIVLTTDTLGHASEALKAIIPHEVKDADEQAEEEFVETETEEAAGAAAAAAAVVVSSNSIVVVVVIVVVV